MFGFLVYAHIFVAVNAVLVAIIIFLFPHFSLKQYLFGGLSLLIGALISMSFWLPMLLEERLTQYSTSYFGINSYKTNLLSIPQLLGFWKIPWGFRPPILGISISVGIIITFVGIFVLRRKNYLLIGSLTACLTSLFFASNLSRFIWNSSSFLQMLQFPWRFLAGATVTGIFAISLFVNELRGKFAILIFLGLILLTFAGNSYFHPSTYNYIAIYTADDACSSTTWANEYFSKWTSVCLPKQKTKRMPLVESINSGAKISQVNESNFGREITYKTVNKNNLQVVVRRYYFPGWNVFVDNKKVGDKPFGKEGLIESTIPPGVHIVRVVWQGSFVENLSNWISAISLFVVIIFLLSYRKLKNVIKINL
jgi:hypothetical protein